MPSKIRAFFAIGNKTVWDWAELLLIPVFLALGAFYLEYRVEQRQEQIAADRVNQEIFSNYLSEMSGLLVDAKLRESGPGSEQWIVAQSLTSTTMKELKSKRNGLLINFLRQSKLLTFEGNSFSLLFGLDIGAVDLRYVYFGKVDLGNANLQGADLRNATFIEADFSGSDLREADLRDVYFGSMANLSDTNLERADLRNVILSGADLSSSNLREADLRNVILAEADLSGSYLEGADLSCYEEFVSIFAVRRNCTYLNDANLSEVNFKRVKLEGAILKGANLHKANFEEANLREVNLSDANLFGADLRHTNLKGADLRRTNLEGASLEGANLEGTNFGGANLREANFSDTNLEGAYLCYTVLLPNITIDPNRDCEKLGIQPD